MKKNLIKYGTILSLLAILIVVLVALFFRKNLTEEKFENHKFYQYLSGIKFEYSGNLKVKNDNSITELLFEDTKVVLDTTPLYYQDEKKVLFPKTMSLIYPKSNVEQYKIVYFSKLLNEDDTIYIQNHKQNKPLYNCFLYDGEDLYFFIENTKIQIGSAEIELSPMSYIILSYNDNIQIYDYEKEEFTKIDTYNEEVTATSSGYKINLSIDAVIYNNESRLLIKNLEYLQNLN
ncbi:MAG: hypothetical protein PHX04_03150 [Bacilli bacterium]|nr:hypothetical protein [Bacilli bacterium]